MALRWSDTPQFKSFEINLHVFVFLKYDLPQTNYFYKVCSVQTVKRSFKGKLAHQLQKNFCSLIIVFAGSGFAGAT